MKALGNFFFNGALYMALVMYPFFTGSLVGAGEISPDIKGQDESLFGLAAAAACFFLFQAIKALTPFPSQAWGRVLKAEILTQVGLYMGFCIWFAYKHPPYWWLLSFVFMGFLIFQFDQVFAARWEVFRSFEVGDLGPLFADKSNRLSSWIGMELTLAGTYDKSMKISNWTLGMSAFTLITAIVLWEKGITFVPVFLVFVVMGGVSLTSLQKEWVGSSCFFSSPAWQAAIQKRDPS